MSTEKKLRVAHIGVGGFGGRRRMTMRETGLFELATCYDLNPEAMAQAQAEDGCTPMGSYEELLDTPGIEAVVISTGAKFHAEQALAAMERGLHVFVEKPLCSTPEEVRQLVEAQQRNKVVVGVGHSDHRNDRMSLTLRRMMDEGQLGNLACFEATTCHSGGLMMKEGDWRADPEKNPGGMLFQCGVHKLHELMFYFGPIREVSAMMRYDVHTTRTADVAICLLRFSNGMVGTLNAYHVCGYRHTFSVFGTGANLYRTDRFFDEGTTVYMQTEDQCGTKQPLVPVGPDPVEVTRHGDVVSFYRAIREGGEPYPSLMDGARAVAVVFAAEESAQQGSCAVPIAQDLA